MDHEGLKELDSARIAGSYARSDVSLERGRGAVCWSLDGRRYVDFGSGIGVNALGYCDPEWVRAVAGQAALLQHSSNLYYTEPCARLAAALTERAGLKKAFFCNSGAEANEAAIKAARKYSFDRHGEGRFEIISLENSFHGRTMAAITATGQEGFHRFFGPFLDGFRYAPADDAQGLRELVSERSCAIMIETVQGEGGVVPISAGFADAIAEICAERDILLIADEIQSGIGRTGRFFSYEHFGLRPDIVTAAKALGGGIPIGAALFGEKCEGVFGPGDHGSTFGGNPVACAGGLVVLDRIDDAFLGRVRDKSALISGRLAAMPGVTDVSGLGLMLGAGLAEGLDAKEIAAACAREGLLLLTAKERLRLLPPLVINEDEIGEGLDILDRVLGDAKSCAVKGKEFPCGLK
ncbi:MAG: acetylornithine/succinylornithine family transaminase [Clostridiales Family XIII bacterium]|jgi:acetylornithine/N-succinyldiaminopimelate aminotransferase|nr:acetylornithine/succinylornithine family transaminase [Clostridiales Family XIII bacterium]